ncbi:2',5'-phosphodiesterase 12 [Nephila pilipes]|uniref:2',5'-phosphodiesterase 12 n=1 Tax=Nephila pilipes TaxID=299642 RepID=A0A8X6TJP6_NEPPI|nr:2',5'-phosphodiesterase 12 [Nephila pilipes]
MYIHKSSFHWLPATIPVCNCIVDRKLHLSILSTLEKFVVFHPSRTMSNCAKVFVKHIETENKMKIYFNFGSSELPDRTFTFLRSKDEKLIVTMSRVKLKLLEAFNNKLKKRKKKGVSENNEANENQFDVLLSLSRAGEELSDDLKNADAWTENTQFQINGFVYKITENPPSVLELSLPKSIMTGFPVYPKVELEYCSKEQCDFTWYRIISKSEKLSIEPEKILKIKNENWLFLSKSYFYIPSETDINCKLKVSCLPKNGEKIGLEETAVSTNLVQEGPEKCPFEYRHEFTKEITEPGKMRCVSYNILADLYADSETARTTLFPYCPAEALMLDYRRQLYLKEIIEITFKSLFSGSNVCIKILCSRRDVEHCSVYKKADLKVFYGIESALTSTGLFELPYEKGGQAVLLESIDIPQKRILVGNTHLYFHPDSDNIRLLQASSCILYLENLLLKYQKENPSCITSLILCGDFNSCPEFGVYHLMTTGSLNEDCIDWHSNPEENVSGIPLKHTLSLDSACGTPPYTNYTEGFVGCLDYIFYNKAHLQVEDMVPFPNHELVIKNTALPSRVFPSDHIALICTLGWK